ncbi:MAG: NADH-quinone oxidoreductase subunit L [Candidatus Brocadiae bacterium]|nr:NADH-quinone oxidoreductase subunit L [Candidatus Brocadiia bacterium]
MNDAARCLTILPFLCLAGFLINGILGRRLGRSAGTLVGVAAALGSFLCALPVAREVFTTGVSVHAPLWTWIETAGLTVNFAFVADRLSVVMLLVVTGVGTLIHLYSAGYMSHDRSVPRYFAYLNLFMFSMLVLILADNLLVLFVGWEGVGLCSYLLIGFWYEDPEKALAGRKAFIVNRIGDFGFVLGMFGLFVVFGSLDFTAIQQNLLTAQDRLQAPVPFLNITTVTAITLALFFGATGKSAQIPLYTWLPDAMAGPTPVSALIHAATMVTSGLYMICRLSHLFVLSPATMGVIAGVGAATALFAALIGLAQTDIKKVLAYSTVSQLGFMFLAMGVGAFSAGFFHVVTHAFFKALLFLGAGSVIHGMSGEQDMRRMGGLRGKLPATFATMLVGTIAIAGIPPLAGFFSKDEIVWRAWSSPQGLILGTMALLSSALTSFYMFRLVAMTFLGQPRGSAEVHSHAHESPWTMVLPLAILAILSAGAGFLNVPEVLHGSAWFSAWLAPVLGTFKPAAAAAAGDHHAAEMGLMVVSTLIAFAGSGLALWIYVKNPGLPAAFVQRSAAMGQMYALVRDRFYIDEAYDRVIVRPVKVIAVILWTFVDVLLIDMFVNLIALVAEVISEAARRIQDGAVGTYAVWFLAGAMLVLGFVVWSGVAA